MIKHVIKITRTSGLCMRDSCWCCSIGSTGMSPFPSTFTPIVPPRDSFPIVIDPSADFAFFCCPPPVVLSKDLSTLSFAEGILSPEKSGNLLLNTTSLSLKSQDCAASLFRTSAVSRMLPIPPDSSIMNDTTPTNILRTPHNGCHDSSWKSVMLTQIFFPVWNLPFGVVK
jgi:hypothetical protein